MPNAEKTLFTPLFKLADHEGMFTIEHGKSTKKWEEFNELLFKQPVFKEHVKTPMISFRIYI